MGPLKLSLQWEGGLGRRRYSFAIPQEKGEVRGEVGDSATEPPTTDEDQAEDLEALADIHEYAHISAAEVKHHHARLQDARLLPGGSPNARA